MENCARAGADATDASSNAEHATKVARNNRLNDISPSNVPQNSSHSQSIRRKWSECVDGGEALTCGAFATVLLINFIEDGEIYVTSAMQPAVFSAKENHPAMAARSATPCGRRGRVVLFAGW